MTTSQVNFQWQGYDWESFEERFNEIKTEVFKMIQGFGFKPKKVPFIPMSGWTGENLTIESEKRNIQNWLTFISKYDHIKIYHWGQVTNISPPHMRMT